MCDVCVPGILHVYIQCTCTCIILWVEGDYKIINFNMGIRSKVSAQQDACRGNYYGCIHALALVYSSVYIKLWCSSADACIRETDSVCWTSCVLLCITPLGLVYMHDALGHACRYVCPSHSTLMRCYN